MIEKGLNVISENKCGILELGIDLNGFTEKSTRIILEFGL